MKIMPDDRNEVFKETEKKRLKDIKERKEKLSNSIINLRNKLMALTGPIKRSEALEELDFLCKFAEYLATESDLVDASVSKYLLVAKTKIYSIILALKSGDATKLIINNKIKNVVLNLNISFDETSTELTEEVKPFQKLVNTKIDKSVTKIVTAPFMFSLPFPIKESTLNRMEKNRLCLKSTGLVFPNWYVCEKANWLVVTKKDLPNAVIKRIADKADATLNFFSKKSASNLSAVHEFSKDTPDYYAVLIIDKNIEDDVTEITNSILKPLNLKKGNTRLSDIVPGMGNSRFNIYLE